MSGIAGIFCPDGQPVDPQLLTRMTDALAHRGGDGAGHWIDGSIALGHRLLHTTPESLHETQPFVSPDGNLVMVCDGRIDNREDLKAALGSTLRTDTDVELIANAYRQWGVDCPAHLIGDFAFAVYDSSRRRLLLARDAIGVRPLYYCRAQDVVLIASEIKALLAHPDVTPRPNDELLADFLLDRVYDQELTFFAGVFSVPPASRLLISPNGVAKHRYWDFDPAARIRLDSFQDYADAFRHVFAQAVQRRLRSRHPVAVSVSGGLDSSSIFCLAKTLIDSQQVCVPSLIGVSYVSQAGSPSDEASFLLDIERHHAVSIDRVPIGPTGLLDGAKQSIWHIESPFMDEQWESTHVFLQHVRGRGARVILTGHWGDQVLFSQAYMVDQCRRFRWKTIRTHLKTFRQWMTDTDPRWFRDRFLKDLAKFHLPAPLFLWLRWLYYQPRQNRLWYTDAFGRRTFQHQWKKRPLGRSLPTAHAQSLYEEVRLGYPALCLEWQNKVAAMHGLEVAFPFMDRDLLSFLMAIPGEMQTHHGVPKALLREAMRGTLPEPIVQRRWKADFTSLVNEGITREYAQLIHYLESGKRAVEFGYVDWRALTQRLDALRTGLAGSTGESAWALSDLLGLEVWLEMFCVDGNRMAYEEGTP